jgi:flagellar motor switch protein FliM
MLDRMLGGSGQPAPANRPLSEIEQNVIDAVVKILLDGLADTWKAVAALTFGIRARETRPQMLQVAAPNEIVVAVIFDVKVGDERGLINLCLPTSVAEIAGTHFATSWQRQRRELSPGERAWMRDNLGRVPLSVVPQIRTGLDAGAVLALRAGEVLALPLPADRPLDVYVGGVRKFAGRLASERGRLMVVVEGRIEAPAAGGA